MIEIGDPVPNILRIAEKENVDLIVVGKKKKEGIETPFLGSRTLQIITRSTRPTLVSKYMVEFDWNGEKITRINKDKFKNPLIAVDWSEPSGKAMGLLLSIGGIAEKVYLCQIIGARALKKLSKAALQKMENESRERLDEACTRLHTAGIEAEQHLGAGKAAEEIVRISRAVGASMIIIGTTGKDRLHEIFLGSNSHRVAEMSELPTLLVP